MPDEKKRLCEEILGGDFRQPALLATNIPLYFAPDDVDAAVLFSAKDAIYGYGPTEVRSLLPFVLDAMERQQEPLFETGYFQVYFGLVNAQFRSPPSGGEASAKIYAFDYEKNKIVPLLSSLSEYEMTWALNWVLDILRADLPLTHTLFGEDLKTLALSLAMALGKDEGEVLPFG